MTLHRVIRLRGVSAICLLVLVPTLQPDYWVVVAVVIGSRRRTLILPRRRRYCLPRRVRRPLGSPSVLRPTVHHTLSLYTHGPESFERPQTANLKSAAGKLGNA